MEAIILAIVLCAVPAGVAFWYWSDTVTLRRELRRARRVSIAEAPEGTVVRLDGVVAEGETLIAPLTGRACVFYLATLEEYVSSGRTGNWRERVRELRGVPFTVLDGTGRAIVDPTGARVDVDIDSTSKSGTLDDPTEAEAAFLRSHGLQGAGWIFNKRLRYREGVFQVGEPIAVMCQPVREPDPDAAARAAAGYRDPAPTRLRVGGSPAHPILLSDSGAVTQRRRRR